MSTFKEYIAPHVADVYDFVKLRNQEIARRQTVLVPNEFSHIPVSQLLNKETEPDNLLKCTIPAYKPDDQDDFLSMVHEH